MAEITPSYVHKNYGFVFNANHQQSLSSTSEEAVDLSLESKMSLKQTVVFDEQSQRSSVYLSLTSFIEAFNKEVLDKSPFEYSKDLGRVRFFMKMMAMNRANVALDEEMLVSRVGNDNLMLCTKCGELELEKRLIRLH